MRALMLQALVLEPGTHRYVIAQLTEKSKSPPADDSEIAEVFGEQIVFHARLGHTSEVAWAIWACLALRIPMDTNAAKAISSLEDDVVALLALHARSLKLLPDLDIGQWLNWMNVDELRGEHWLLAYEACEKGWLCSPSAGDYIDRDPHFGWMRRERISFYNENISVEVPDNMLGRR